MHELGFAEDILRAVEKTAADWPDARVTRVRVLCGPLLALEPASLRFCLETLTSGTRLADTVFEIMEMSTGESPPGDAHALIIDEVEIDDDGSQA